MSLVTFIILVIRFHMQ